jgi:exopolysaccharide biosynthesis polyprenyl glycosylphosphotransferase
MTQVIDAALPDAPRADAPRDDPGGTSGQSAESLSGARVADDSPGGSADDSADFSAQNTNAPTPRQGSLMSHLPPQLQRWQNRYIACLVLVDALACETAIVLAWLFTGGSANATSDSNRLVLWAVPGWVAVLGLSRAYDQGFVGIGAEEFRRVARGGVRCLAVLAVVSLGLKLNLSRAVVGIIVPGTVLLTFAFRGVCRLGLQRLRSMSQAQHGVVVVGNATSSLDLVLRLKGMPEQAFAIRRVCCADELTVDDVLTAIRESGADTVAIAGDSGLSAAELRRLGWELEGTAVDLIVSTDLVEVAGPRIHVRPMAGLPLLHVEQPELGGIRRLVKGTYDRVGAFLALAVAAPFMLLLVPVIRMSSHGPAIFRQVRVGLHGELFTVLKFRTMRIGAHDELGELQHLNESDGPLFKLRADPRTTRVGAILRRYSIDELPQLLNVLFGHMSLVGPRPPLPEEVATYGPSVGRRFLVKPGLTGLWQVSGRADLSWEQTVRLDLSYVENWTPALDLQILLRTVAVVLRRKGAY